MRVVIQRVKQASVVIGAEIIGSVGQGLLILVGIEHDDCESDADWLTRKISNLRVFDDEKGVMNLDIKKIGGEILVVSQFTLHAKTKKGNRPSYIRAADPAKAIPLYDYFIRQLERESGVAVKTGQFGAEMDISLLNSGPVTIIIDTRLKE